MGGQVDDIFRAKAVRNPKGHMIVDGAVVADTLQCCHCGGHWVPVHGSGRRRGWCMSCGSPTCGARQCDECVPTDLLLQRIEGTAKGR